MDHRKLITETLRKYSDFPNIQSDMKRLLKYAESQNRMFLNTFIREDSPAPVTNPDPRDEALDAIIAKFQDRPGFEDAVNRLGVIIFRSAAYRENHTDEIRTILDGLRDDPEALQAAREAGNLTLSVINEAATEVAAK